MKTSYFLTATAATFALALGGMSGCKKESAVDSASPATAATASENNAPAPSAAPGVAAAPEGTREGSKGDIVAIGSSGKAQVIATGKQTLADTDTYTVTLAAPAKLAKGAKGAATLEIIPKTGWKLNQEFPTKVTITPPAGVEVAKSEQSVADAVAFGEKSARFAIDFTSASEGAKAFTGKLKFAVCTEVSCDPKKEELAWNVQVE